MNLFESNVLRVILSTVDPNHTAGLVYFARASSVERGHVIGNELLVGRAKDIFARVRAMIKLVASTREGYHVANIETGTPRHQVGADQTR